MRLFLAFLLLVVAIPATAVAQAPLRFAGEAQIGAEPPVPVHVELVEQASAVTGVFTTGDSQFEFQGARNGELIRGTLAAGEVVGAAELRVGGDEAKGSFELGGQKGALRLRRTDKDAQAYLRPSQDIELTTAQWLEDLDELGSILTTKHGGPFDHVSRAAFLSRVHHARQLIPRQTGVENALLFRKLAALIGDGHTEVAFVRGRPLYPLETFSFEDGLRVIAAPPEHNELLGAKLVAVNGVPIRTIVDRLRAYIGQHETEWAYRSSYPWLLERADLLQDAGITNGPVASYAFLIDGKSKEVAIAAGPPGKDLVRYGRGAPLWERNPDEGFWYERWPDGTVYVNWRSYEDLDAKSEALLSQLDRNHPRRLIIDLRDSGGGDFEVGRRFIGQLRSRPWLDRRGVLFVLTGRRTFSAAMTNAADFKLNTNATLVGEPAGAAPNGWQEVRSFHLPNSGLRVSVSTKKYEFLPGQEQVDPDVLIPAQLSDWAAEKDAATRYIVGARE